MNRKGLRGKLAPAKSPSPETSDRARRGCGGHGPREDGKPVASTGTDQLVDASAHVIKDDTRFAEASRTRAAGDRENGFAALFPGP
jgi:hypothetical protein